MCVGHRILFFGLIWVASLPIPAIPAHASPYAFGDERDLAQISAQLDDLIQNQVGCQAAALAGDRVSREKVSNAKKQILEEVFLAPRGKTIDLSAGSLAAIQQIAILGSAEDLPLLKKLALGINKETGKYIYTDPVYDAATEAIASILDRLFGMPSEGSTARKQEETHQLILRWNREGILNPLPKDQLNWIRARIILRWLTHPMAKVQLLEIYPTLVSNPQLESKLLAKEHLTHTLSILRSDPELYDPAKAAPMDRLALSILKQTDSTAYGKLNKEYQSLLAKVTGVLPVLEEANSADSSKPAIILPNHEISVVATLPIIELREREQVQSVAVTPDGKYVVTATRFHQITLWDAKTGHEILNWKGLGPFFSLAISPDSKKVFTGGAAGRITVWDIKDGSEITTWEDERLHFVSTLATAPGFKYLVAGGRNGHYSLFDLKTGERFERKPLQQANIKTMAISPDGTKLVTAGVDRTVLISDIESGRVLSVLKGHRGQVSAVAFSRDGDWVVTGSSDGTAKVWLVQGGADIYTIKASESPITAVAVSPLNEKWIFTASEDHTVKVWDRETGQQLLNLIHDDEVRSIAVSFDGKILVCGSNDRSIVPSEDHSNDHIAKMWNLEALGLK